MKSITYVGLDVHKNSYTVCCYQPKVVKDENDKVDYHHKFEPDYRHIINYINGVKHFYGEDTYFVCGYEAGALGYTLYHQLTSAGIKCIILAPSTMGTNVKARIKTDRRDAENIARCLAYGNYSAVYVPSQTDNEIKEYIRMRNDKKEALKKIKQQLLAFVLKHGYRYEGGRNYWTLRHVKWLRSLEMTPLLKEILEEYLISYDYLTNKLERLEERIDEFANQDDYHERVKKLVSLMGVKNYTALSVIVETGDFKRFKKASNFASFLGLVPSEDSSGDIVRRGEITKAGNSQIRKLLVESAQSYARGTVGHKSKELKRRQNGNSAEVIAYADKANERLRRKFYRMVLTNGTPRNKAVTAIARELACFMWGLMTDNIA